MSSSDEPPPSGITLYTHPMSPPGIAINMLCEMLNVPCAVVNIDLFAGEHKKDEFLKINPLGLVPAIKDGDFLLAESRAVMPYLVERYGGAGDNPLYPASALRDRARILNLLMLDLGTFYPAIAEYVYPQVFLHHHNPLQDADPAKLQKLRDKTAILEKMLASNGGGFLLGKHLTIADISVFCSSHMAMRMVAYNLDDFPNMKQWVDRVKEIVGVDRYDEHFNPMTEFRNDLKK